MVNEQIIDISGPLKGEIEVPGDKNDTRLWTSCWLPQDISLLTRHIKYCIQVILVRQHDYWQVC